MSLVRDQESIVAADVSEREVRAQLDRILQSGTFKNSEPRQRFLKFAVERVLDGTTDQLKEAVLGGVVLDQGFEFDPRSDSMVPTERAACPKPPHKTANRRRSSAPQSKR